MIHVQDLLTDRAPLTLGPVASTRDAALAMTSNHVGCVLIVDAKNRPLGIFTERDLMTRVVVPGKAPEDVTLREVMTPELFVVDAKRPIQEVRREMQERHIRHLPVVSREGVLVAVLSLRDLLRADLREQRDNLQAMTDYIQGKSA